LLRPDDKTNNAFIYCLAEAAQRFDIDVMLPVAESNHHHLAFFARHANYPQFVEHFHKMAARCLNARWGRWENFWASEEPCITTLLDRHTIIEKLAYAATNPVKDHLVERVHHWPGVNGFTHLVNGRVLRARRPRFFFDPNGDMPEEVTLELKIPAELGPADEVIHELKERVAQIEKQVREDRRRTGRSIVGRREIKRQSWTMCPSSKAPRRNLRPRFAGLKKNRIAAIVAFREFLACYREARRDWLEGREPSFPQGTYWLARFTPLAVAVEKLS
jgi:putative transposase